MNCRFMKNNNRRAKKINLILVGIGPHAKRAYIPYLLRLQKSYNIEIAAIVELKEMEALTRDYFKSLSLSPKQIYIDRFKGEKIPHDLKNFLDHSVTELSLGGLIIAAEPQVHKPFALWGLENSLHILMDKPISTRVNAAINESDAEKIYTDYQELLRAYRQHQRKRKTIFSVHVQRRYHAGFHKVFQLIREITNKTGCPITSLQSMHADGQWRLPSELVDIPYHGFNQGYGKISHSGYHFFDLTYQLLQSSYIRKKWPDSADVYSSFLLPEGLLTQMNEDDFEKCFSNKYRKISKYSHKQLIELSREFGEIDAFTLLDLKKRNTTICQISINLIHNSFSRRSWIEPAKDLYKGNGRVKHETHSIQQGPFQSIHVHSYQMKDGHDKNSQEDYDLGGNNHFDIHVFRNVGIVGGNPYSKIRIDELLDQEFKKEPGLVIEQIKEGVVREFLDALNGKIKKSKLISSIEDHEFAVRLMSAVYVSHIRKMKGNMPVVSFPVSHPIRL